jgi:myo-inositol-1(or 4)-monophosphatase
MDKAVEKAAFGIVRDFGELERLQNSKKGSKAFAAVSEKRTEEHIAHMLAKSRQDIPIACNEMLDFSECIKKPIWIVCPIDGIHNFTKGIPHFAINVSVIENGEVTAGITLNPVRGECFRAEKGNGAFSENRSRLRVSNCENIQDAVISTYITHQDEKIIAEHGAVIRKTGAPSIDLAYLAAGKYDGCVIKGVKQCAIATGELLVRESGGFFHCVKQQGGLLDIYAAASYNLLKKMLNLYHTP